MKYGKFRPAVQDQSQRRPRCRIEAKLQDRKLRNTQTHKINWSLESDATELAKVERNEQNAEDNGRSSESTISSSENGLSTSSTSKQRVDLLEPLPRRRCTLSNPRTPKVIQKILFKNDHERQQSREAGNGRPRSAPYTPLFRIKCSKKKSPRQMLAKCAFFENDGGRQDKKLVRSQSAAKRGMILLRKSRSDTSTNMSHRCAELKDSKPLMIVEKPEVGEKSFKNSHLPSELGGEAGVQETAGFFVSPTKTTSKTSKSKRVESDSTSKENSALAPRNVRSETPTAVRDHYAGELEVFVTPRVPLLRFQSEHTRDTYHSSLCQSEKMMAKARVSKDILAREKDVVLQNGDSDTGPNEVCPEEISIENNYDRNAVNIDPLNPPLKSISPTQNSSINETPAPDPEKPISNLTDTALLTSIKRKLDHLNCTTSTQVDENMILCASDHSQNKVDFKEMETKCNNNISGDEFEVSLDQIRPHQNQKELNLLAFNYDDQIGGRIDERQRYRFAGRGSNNFPQRATNQAQNRFQQPRACWNGDCTMTDHRHHRCAAAEHSKRPLKYVEASGKNLDDIIFQQRQNRLVSNCNENQTEFHKCLNFHCAAVNKIQNDEFRQFCSRRHACVDKNLDKNSPYENAVNFHWSAGKVIPGTRKKCITHDFSCHRRAPPSRDSPTTFCRCERPNVSPRRVTFCLPPRSPSHRICSKAPENVVREETRNMNFDLHVPKVTGPSISVRETRKFFCNEIVDKHQNILGANVQRNCEDSAWLRKEIRNEKSRKIEHTRKPDESAIISSDEQQSVATYAKVLAAFQRSCEKTAVRQCYKKDRPIVCRAINGDISEKHSPRNNWTRICHPKNFGDSERKIRQQGPCEFFNRHVTMQSNGSDGVSENGVDKTGWTVGLINGKYKYLTAETFGFKINANGSSLKKKQLWTLEGSEHQVFLRSHLDRYLAVDQFGNVTCEAEDPSDPGCAFQIQLASDGSGRWAFKNIQRGYFLGSSQDELKCTAKAPGEAEYWLVHLAARPQVNLRSAGRKRFAHLSAAQDEIHVDAPVPWGEDTLFTLEFRPASLDQDDSHGNQKSEGGHYALHTCNNKYLARDGKLLETCTRDCLYAAEFHAGLLALRDIHGAYLAPIGSKAVLKSRSTTVTRDELFSLEESLPQASFVAALNQRYVSVKQGVDVTANQDEISGHETFQLEFDRVTKRWYIRTMQDRYWSLEAGGGIQASDHKRSSNALFDLVWQSEDGTVALRANNGKFLSTKRSGHLYANADSTNGDSDACKYYFYLMNRPVLVLRCEQGFVGPKSAASPKLECNKAGYETIRVERCERGIVRFKGQNGKYWHADSEGVTVDSDMPSDGFYLELREPSRICIKCTDGRYLAAGKNGALRLGETDYDSATKWEF